MTVNFETRLPRIQRLQRSHVTARGERLKRIARRVASYTALLAAGLKQLGASVIDGAAFDTVCVSTGAKTDAVLQAARDAGINLRRASDASIGITLDETTTREDITLLWSLFAGGQALPDFAGAFPKLRTCKLRRNKLAALPAFGGALVSLDLSENRVTSAGLEACLAEATALEELRCAKNPLGAGCGPAALAKLAKLRILVVSDCGLTALLLFDGALWPALVEVVADGNAIAGLDDALAARAPALRRLSLEPVPKPNLQPDFNVSVFECFDTSSSAGLRELDESDRSVQKSAESTSI